MSRWLMGGDRVLPRRLRWVFFAFGLAVLGGTYAATGSEGAQALVLLALTFGILPAATRALGQRTALIEVTRNRTAPLGVLAISLAFLVLWGALIFVAVPELGLGPWFWWWVVMWPWLEIYLFLAERRLRRDGGASWKPVRPWRDSALAGLATVPVIALITVVQGVDIGEALLTGLSCGCVGFLIVAAFTWMSRRAQDATEPT